MKQDKKNLWYALGGGMVIGAAITAVVFALTLYPQTKMSAYVNEAPKAQIAHLDKHGPRFHHHRHGADFKRFKEPTPEMKARFAAKLGLSDEQRATLEQYRIEDMAKMEPLMKQMDELHQQMKDLRKANRERFESVLTEEQVLKLKSMRRM